MTFKIGREGNGYKLNISEAGYGYYTVHATDIEEVKLSIQHYFEKSWPSDDKCPLCERSVRALPAESRYISLPAFAGAISL